MTKRLISLAIFVLLVGVFITSARAEISNEAYTGKKYYEQQVWITAYNNSSGTIPNNSVVILSTAGTAADSLGAYVVLSTTVDNALAIGVSDELIAANSVGRICVRGPHLVRHPYDSAAITWTAGSTVVGSSGGTGFAYSTADGTIGGQLGVAINTSSAATSWVWIAPQIHK